MTLKFKNIHLGIQKNNRYYNTPAVVLEVSGCNLRCMFGNNLCKDSIQSSKATLTVEDAKRFIAKNSEVNHIVITGGEPLMYKSELEDFLNSVWRDDMVITIHTNGTLPILNPLASHFKIALYIVDLVNGALPREGETVKTINGNSITFGTTDVESLSKTIFNRVFSLQRLCIYSHDYLLLMNPEEDMDKQVKELELRLKVSDNEFISSYLDRYPIKDHIVFIGNSSNNDHIAKMCMKKGYKFNSITKI